MSSVRLGFKVIEGIEMPASLAIYLIIERGTSSLAERFSVVGMTVGGNKRDPATSGPADGITHPHRRKLICLCFLCNHAMVGFGSRVVKAFMHDLQISSAGMS
jgi:hypothetical protein